MIDISIGLGLEKVSLSDWATVLLIVLAAIIIILQRFNMLPKAARNWLDQVGQKQIEAIIAKAEAYDALQTAEARRQWVVAELQTWTKNELGYRIPTSVANLVVEYVYSKWRSANLKTLRVVK